MLKTMTKITNTKIATIVVLALLIGAATSQMHGTVQAGHSGNIRDVRYEASGRQQVIQPGGRPAAPADCTNITGSIGPGDQTQTGVLLSGLATACGVPDTCAIDAGRPGNHAYDAYTFFNTTNAFQCVTIAATTSLDCGIGNIEGAAYVGSFDSSNICTNWLGGAVFGNGADASFSVTVGPDSQFVVVLSERAAGAGCSSYTLNVTGPGITCAPPMSFCNNVPTVQVNPQGPNAATWEPYPSTILVSGLVGTIANLTVNLSGVTHTSPDNMEVLLVGPPCAAGIDSCNIVLMSDAGGLTGITNVDLAFRDGQPLLPDETIIASGTYGPTDYPAGIEGWESPAPALMFINSPPTRGTATFASVFNGTNPNGTWSLYVRNDKTGSTGAIAGWCLNIAVNSPVCALDITCPSNIVTTATASCPIAAGSVVTFPDPIVTDPCPATVTCNPPSGSTFPVGTTTVTCTATDTGGNIASCSFTVTVFSLCLQDDSNSGNVVLVNAQTGDYRFCCNGTPIASGTGVLTTRACIGSIDHTKGDRRVHIQWDTSANGAGAGTAIVQTGPNKTVCQISDMQMNTNSCQCASSPPAIAPPHK